MQKKVLADTNIFVYYSEGRKDAVSFFKKVRVLDDFCIYVLEDVYAEAKTVSFNFDKIRNIISELYSKGIYQRVKLNEQEKEYAEKLSQRSIEEFGHVIDRTDRRIIAVAKFRNLKIHSNDNELLILAQKEGIAIY